MTEFHDDQYWGHVPHVPMYHQGHRHNHIPVFSNVGDDERYDAVVFSDMGEGPKGEKGDPTYFDDLTEDQLQEIYKQASFVGNKSQDAIVTTSDNFTTVVTIPFDYDGFDMLFVDVNGLDLAEGDDYSIVGNTVSLVTPLPASQEIHFRALKYQVVDGNKTITNTMGRKDYCTVSEMKSDSALEPGDITHTLGYDTMGDGNDHWYYIMSHGVADNDNIIALSNGLYAYKKI